MYLKVPSNYKKTVVSIQKIETDDGYIYELNLRDGYGLYGSEDETGLIYFESYKEMVKEMKYIKGVKK